MKTVQLFFCCLLLNLPLLGNSQELVDIADFPSKFEYDVRYATTHNFIGEALYDCAVCLLQPEVADALLKANQYFCEKGYRIQLYDCYRPLDIQKKMWAKVPRPTYVANPYGKGSIHNKGAAVDITLVTLEGCFVDMGSDYDHFGRESHIDNYNFSEETLSNRKLLREGMQKFGFGTVRTEWWHYSYRKNWSYPTLNEPLPCEE
ncbi:M15 family metallopeptidase [Marinirhabdus gelatinilytica]|uniref:D-alanyl-D-alanine dipeptidase n=1 Tax=Marinirhabdus gelatinilytica TaxID=1703343 RepID=A0A370QA47_9FLAO|nr:M15 family metallopeptidase [Marinirhabdus gelatinilytica]RDK85255.1 D-alanyl-D-alanine dipeptidase [Marinirhabdus gelatinilytica]